MPPPSPKPEETRCLPANARLFVWFRVLFNCRFYYPVFTVLFLDLGLTLAEFAALNVIWAATIVIFEVPSGALADQFGRRRLVVIAGWLMAAEMAVLCLMPAGHHDAVLALFVLNRVLSGAAEACASGADEALAYDSLPEGQREQLWRRVMARLSRAMAVGFVISSISGGILYDQAGVSALFEALGWHGAGRGLTMKVPLALNFLTAVACLLMALAMKEPPAVASLRGGSWRHEARLSLKRMADTARWIWQTPAALSLLLFGIVFDSIIRLFLTVSSNFYRLVGIHEVWYGVIGTVGSLLALATAGLMERMSGRHGAAHNFAWLAAVVFLGLCALAHPQPGWLGIALIMPLTLSIRFLHFFLSHYLNAVVSSERRATALSFRGLSINLAYGILTLLFGLQCKVFEKWLALPASDLRVFAATLTWWPWWFAATLLISMLFLRLRFPPTRA